MIVLDDVLGSRVNIAILRYLSAIQGGLSGNDIAKRLEIQQSSARQALERLVDTGVITRTDVGRTASYMLDTELAFVRSLLLPLFRKEAHLREELIEQTAKVVRALNPSPQTVILFGSLARGMRDCRDVDLLCVVSKANEKIVVHDSIAETFEKVQRRYKVPVSAVVATETELRSLSLTSVVTEARRDGILLAGKAPPVLQGVRVWSHTHPHAA